MDRGSKTFLKDRIAASAIAAGVCGWLFCVLLVVAFWNKLPPELPFLYSLPWGESWLIAKDHLIWVLAGFGLVLIFNLILALILKKEKLLQYYLLWGAAAVEFMLAVNLVKIIDLIV